MAWEEAVETGCQLASSATSPVLPDVFWCFRFYKPVPGMVHRFRCVCLGLIFCSLLLKQYVTYVAEALLASRRSYGWCCWALLRPACTREEVHKARDLDEAEGQAVRCVKAAKLCRGKKTQKISFAGGYKTCVSFAGIAVLYLHLHDVYGDPAYLHVAHEYVKKSLSCLTRRSITFLCGDAGPLAVAAVIYHKLQNHKQSEDCITR